MKVPKWEEKIIRNDHDYYLKEKVIARKYLSHSIPLKDQVSKLEAIIFGDYHRAFLNPQIDGKEIPSYDQYKRHWLFAQKENEPYCVYDGFQFLYKKHQVQNITEPMIESGKTYVGKMWGLG